MNCRFLFSWLLVSGLLLASDAAAIAREDTRLDSGWQFKSGDSAGAEKTDFAAGDWPAISLPHCWGWQEAQQGKPYYRGPAWYRRELALTPEAGKRYFLRFEAASLVADVYLNGQFIGQHRGGFGAFCFEITTNLAAGGKNLLAVRVSNQKFSDIAPLGGDFSVYGGLYRPVHLIVTGPENFALTDHGSPGVAWLQTSVSATQAVLEVNAKISSQPEKSNQLKITAKILDAAGNVVAAESREFKPAAALDEQALKLTVPQPHLWNGRKNPYLYRAVAEVSADGKVIDVVEQPLGLRFYHVDPDQGFFLNGQPYHLHGVNRHQDMQDKGWAITETDMERDLALLKEIGATVIRCCHYEHSDYFYSLCDRAGILVWAEIPQVNTVSNTPEFFATSSRQLQDLIRQNINHPAIFAWSLFNEVGNGPTDDPHTNFFQLNQLAHQEDPTRLTVAAASVQKKEWADAYRTMDLLAWNTYPGWYAGAATNMAAFLDRHRNSSQHGGIGISEYGAGANIVQHEDHPAHPKTTGPWHPEEWQNLVHETTWAQMKARPFVWGTFVWNMFDFAVDTRHEGGIPGRNTKGLVTYDRQTKKDAFYFYKANWSDEPVLYITSRRFTERTNAVTDIKIYSNAEKAELFVNGVSQAARENNENAVFIWKNIQLMPGKNRIEAKAQRGSQPLTDSCVWELK
jgi:beta-galactosidase